MSQEQLAENLETILKRVDLVWTGITITLLLFGLKLQWEISEVRIMVKAYVADWKKEKFKTSRFRKVADVVGLVDVSGIGAKQMLDMRASLRTWSKVKDVQKSSTKRAIEASSKIRKCRASY